MYQRIILAGWLSATCLLIGGVSAGGQTSTVEGTPTALAVPAAIGAAYSARSSETPSGIRETRAALGGSTAPAIDASASGGDRLLASKLINAERVNIRIQGYPNMSGEYRVGGDGTIGLLGLGRFEVSNKTITEFEGQLSEAVTRLSSRDTSVTVEVLDYRPIFVTGHVARAGAFPWKPGLSVLQAEILAGGIPRQGAGAGAGVLGGPVPDVEADRAKRAAYEMVSTLATIARLRTEKENGSKIAIPPPAVNLVSPSYQEQVLAAQEATLKSRNAAFQSRVAALENARTLAIKEKDALEAQRERMNSQLAKRRAILLKIERIAEKGYLRADRVFEDQVRIAELEERLTSTIIAISRMNTMAANAQNDLDVVIRGRAEIDTEILRLEGVASQLQLEVESANGAFRRITGHDLAARQTLAAHLSYEIVRTEGGSPSALNADKSTLLRPGDVVVVNIDNTNRM